MANLTPDMNQSPVRRTGRAAAAGLDVLLSEAGTGEPSRFIAPGAAAKVSASDASVRMRSTAWPLRSTRNVRS